MRRKHFENSPVPRTRGRVACALALAIAVVAASQALAQESRGRESRPRWFSDLRFESASAVEEMLALRPPAIHQPPPLAAEEEPLEDRVEEGLKLSLELSSLSRIELDAPPAYLPRPGDYRSRWERVQGERREAYENLLRKEFYRHTRRVLKRQWRTQFEESTTMRYEFYRARVNEISALGVERGEFDPFGTRQFADELRDDLLEVGAEGERELVLLDYGPFRLTDEGSFRLEVPSLLRLGSAGPLSLPRRPVGAAPERTALYSRDWLKLRPGIKVRVDPLRAVAGGDPTRLLRSFGASLDADFYSGILRKKLFAAEMEATARPSGEVAFVFNLIFESRV